nr:MAK10-like protein [Tanacetum cinerariifolium]
MCSDDAYLVMPHDSALAGCGTLGIKNPIITDLNPCFNQDASPHGGSYYSFPCLILSIGKDRKTPQRYPDVPTTSRRISLESIDSFQGLASKSPSSWHRPLASNSNFLRSTGDGITTIKQRHHDTHDDRVKDLSMTSGRGRLKVDLEPSTWRWRQDLSFLCVNCFVTHSRQPPLETRILSALLEITPNLAMRATGTPSPHREQRGTSLIRHHPVGAKRMLILQTLDLALYDNESRNNPRDFAKPMKAITLPQDVPSTSECCLIELENQDQWLMEAHLALTQPTQVNRITTSCEICSGPYDTQYCMEDPEQAFVEYASSYTDKTGGKVYDIDIREDEKRPFILGTSFLMTAKVVIKFDKGTITPRSRKSKISFHMIPKSLGKVEKGIKNDIEPIAPTMTMNRLVLE